MEVYMIGGSPCSGKSTVAQALAERYGLYFFKIDVHLEQYMQKAAEAGKPCCSSVRQMSPEQIWMREPQVQCHEELLIYEEIFEYIMADLLQTASGRPVITEGAALLPHLVQRSRIPYSRYLSITPTKEFQVSHYRQREWVPQVLAGCSNKETAFDNWMERDALFAKAVQQQCQTAGYVSLLQNGSLPPEELIGIISAHFRLV